MRDFLTSYVMLALGSLRLAQTLLPWPRATTGPLPVAPLTAHRAHRQEIATHTGRLEG